MTRRALAAIAIVAGTVLAQAVAAETLLVLRASGSALEFIDPGSGLRLAAVPLAPGPHAIATSPDGRLAGVTNAAAAQRSVATLSIIDLDRPRVLRRIDLPPNVRPQGVAWFAADRLAVASEGAHQLLIVDPITGRILSAVGTGQDGAHRVAVTPDGSRAYLTNPAAATTTAIELRTGRKLAEIATGRGSDGIALTPDGGELWVAAGGDGRIAVVNTASLEVEARLPLPGTPARLAVAPDGKSVVVACAGASELVVFDVSSRRERLRRPIELTPAPQAAQSAAAGRATAPRPIGLLISPDGRNLYVATVPGDAVLRFDAAMLAVQQISALDVEPDGLAATAVLPRAECHACKPSSR